MLKIEQNKNKLNTKLVAKTFILLELLKNEVSQERVKKLEILDSSIFLTGKIG